MKDVTVKCVRIKAQTQGHSGIRVMNDRKKSLE